MSAEPQASPPTPSPSQPSSPAATDKTIPGVYTTKLGRFGVLLLMGTLSWTIPAASYGTLTQALFAETDPDNKIWMVAVLATVSSIGGVLGVIFGGLLSDRTRSKWGKRKPWLLAGALLSGCSMAPIWFTTSFALLVALFTLCHVGVNVMVAALSALLPDRVDKKLLAGLQRCQAWATCWATPSAGWSPAASCPRQGSAWS